MVNFAKLTHIALVVIGLTSLMESNARMYELNISNIQNKFFILNFIIQRKFQS
jgi:hypothetical protein